MNDTEYAARDAERRFRNQARSMLSILAILALINAVTSWGHWWIQWPALGLGIGLIMQYRKVLAARDDAAEATTATPLLDANDPEPLRADDLVSRAEALAARERDTR